MRIAPRKESEFVEELKEWFMASDKNAIVHKTFSVTGEPDLYFATRGGDGSLREFRAEAKFVQAQPKSLRVLYQLLRENQQKVIPRLAAASRLPIYLITCIAGREALWHRFDPNQAMKAMMGKIPYWHCLVLAHISIRTPQGKWIIVEPNDPRIKS